MLSSLEYRQLLSELVDELPQEFFRELSGGVIMSEAAPVPDYARANDLFTLGHYQVSHGMRQIVMYLGSFNRVYPLARGEEAKGLLRGILRHEFRHHLEFLGGIHNSTSLEAEDERAKEAYLAAHEE